MLPNLHCTLAKATSNILTVQYLWLLHILSGVPQASIDEVGFGLSRDCYMGQAQDAGRCVMIPMNAPCHNDKIQNRVDCVNRLRNVFSFEIRRFQNGIIKQLPQRLADFFVNHDRTHCKLARWALA